MRDTFSFVDDAEPLKVMRAHTKDYRAYRSATDGAATSLLNTLIIRVHR